VDKHISQQSNQNELYIGNEYLPVRGGLPMQVDHVAALFVFIEVVQVPEFFIPEFIDIIVTVNCRWRFLPNGDSHRAIIEFQNLLFGAHGTSLSCGAKRHRARLSELSGLLRNDSTKTARL
jgi:hypothetical protein